MRTSEFIKRFLAGVFFLIGCVIIASAIYIIGLERGLAQPKFTIDVLFRDVGGLIEGAPVRLAGVNIGVVHKIDFLVREIEGRKLKVTMSVLSRYRDQLKKSSSVSIRTEGVLGEKLVEIKADPKEVPLNIDRYILGEDPLDVYDFAEVLADTAVSLKLTADGITALTKEVGYISVKTKRLLNRIEQKIIDGNLFKVF